MKKLYEQERAFLTKSRQALLLVLYSNVVFVLLQIHFTYLQPIITQYFIDNKSEIWLLFLIAHSKR